MVNINLNITGPALLASFTLQHIHSLNMQNMSAKIIFCIVIFFPNLAMAELSSESICEMAEETGRLNEVSYAQCTCAMNKADEHLDDDMKLALVEAMLAGSSPIHAMLARGYKMNVIADALEKYGEATFADCGSVLSF